METAEIPDGMFPTRQQSNTEPNLQQLRCTVLVMIGICKPRAPEPRWITQRRLSCHKLRAWRLTESLFTWPTLELETWLG